MRTGLRVFLPLTAVIIIVACIFAFFEVRGEQRHIRQGLEKHAEVLAERLADSVEAPLERGAPKGLQHTVDRLGSRLVGLAV
jgi:hypothetical protein